MHQTSLIGARDPSEQLILKPDFTGIHLVPLAWRYFQLEEVNATRDIARCETDHMRRIFLFLFLLPLSSFAWSKRVYSVYPQAAGLFYRFYFLYFVLMHLRQSAVIISYLMVSTTLTAGQVPSIKCSFEFKAKSTAAPLLPINDSPCLRIQMDGIYWAEPRPRLRVAVKTNRLQH